MTSVHIYSVPFSSFGRVVQLVCEQKGISYSMGLEVAGMNVEFKGEQHANWHPYSKMPVLLIGDQVLCESASIIRYLDNAYPGPELQPTDPWLRAKLDERVQLLSTYINHALIKDYILELIFPKGQDGAPRLDVMAANKPAALKALSLLESWLAEGDYLFGNSFSLADAMALPSLYYVTQLQEPFNLLPADSVIGSYVQRMKDKYPACQKVLVPKQPS
ncbi:hypothetical protein GCM10009092_06660 [Bowmanella denitrificans]|uniref:Glutathione S-transferase n=1 Tax=Bowmanella denitrificans TaxID=366582 RepID=A0ABP3GGB3_9ALTE